MQSPGSKATVLFVTLLFMVTAALGLAASRAESFASNDGRTQTVEIGPSLTTKLTGERRCSIEPSALAKSLQLALGSRAGLAGDRTRGPAQCRSSGQQAETQSGLQLAQEAVCPDGYPVDCGSYCCTSDSYCAAGGCCPLGTSSCGDTCCDSGYFCGSGGGYCCAEGTDDCGDGCCPQGYRCCGDGCCSLCGECSLLLFNSLVSCVNSSALPFTCIQQALAAHSNCANRIAGGCGGSCGAQLTACVEGSCAQYGYDSDCVIRCLEGNRACQD